MNEQPVQQNFSALAWYSIPGRASIDRIKFQNRLIQVLGSTEYMPKARAHSDAARMAIRNLTEATIATSTFNGKIVSAEVKDRDVKQEGWAWDLHLRSQSGTVVYTRFARIVLQQNNLVLQYNPDNLAITHDLEAILRQGLAQVPAWTQFYQDNLDATQLRAFLGEALKKVRFPVKNGVFWVLGRNLPYVQQVAGILEHLDSGNVQFSAYTLQHDKHNTATLQADLTMSIDEALTDIQNKLAGSGKIGKAELEEFIEYIEDLRLNLAEFEGVLGAPLVARDRIENLHGQVSEEIRNWKRGGKS